MEKIKLKFICLGALFFGTFFSLVVLHGDAFAKTSLVLTPMLQQIVLIPGETYDGSVTVGNADDADEDLHYVVGVGPYNMFETEDGSETYDDFYETTELNTIVDWTTLENEEGVLKPGEEAKVKFRIEVPKTAAGGGQYMAFLVGGKKEIIQEDNSVAIKQTANMAAKVLAQVTGETRESANILENNIPSFLLNGELEVVSLVENDGNMHAEANYVLQVWPMGSDEEICTNEENAGAILVLPGAKQYHKESCAIGAPGIYKAKQTVTIAGETSIVEATIVYCPIWLMLVIVFGIVMIVMWLVMATRGRKKKAARAEVKTEAKTEGKTDKDE